MCTQYLFVDLSICDPNKVLISHLTSTTGTISAFALLCLPGGRRKMPIISIPWCEPIPPISPSLRACEKIGFCQVAFVPVSLWHKQNMQLRIPSESQTKLTKTTRVCNHSFCSAEFSVFFCLIYVWILFETEAENGHVDGVCDCLGGSHDDQC